jgi:hypothetical protein
MNLANSQNRHVRRWQRNSFAVIHKAYLKFPTLMRGTGHLADEITLTGNFVAIDISKDPMTSWNF